jgi:DNA-damage-inducible protein D
MSENQFELIKKVDNNGSDYWSSRELARVLDYADYRNFLTVVNKAKIACENSGEVIHNHFVDTNEMVQIGSGAEKAVDTTYLSRYACYLIVQNSDPTKVVVAKGQTYFAIQTRRQETADSRIEDHNRVVLREEMKKHNTSLMQTASTAGVESFAIFQNAGYKGLYGGLTMQDIHNRKGLKKTQKILDHMNSEELAANLFRATQTDAKIKRDKIKGQGNANLAHFEVGQKVRNTIASLGGTMPEKLPVMDGINKAQTRLKKFQKKKLNSENPTEVGPREE